MHISLDSVMYCSSQAKPFLFKRGILLYRGGCPRENEVFVALIITSD